MGESSATLRYLLTMGPHMPRSMGPEQSVKQREFLPKDLQEQDSQGASASTA